jgi:sphinganine-1-phosphate aldolase
MSINADVHKFGYAPKGSSVLIYRNSTIRMNQYYAMSTWPGGIYISPTAMGTRNGGCLSSAWGSLLDLGIEGFKETTKNILAEVDKFVEYISSHQELKLMAIPDSTIVSFECKNFSCYKLADAL